MRRTRSGAFDVTSEMKRSLTEEEVRKIAAEVIEGPDLLFLEDIHLEVGKPDHERVEAIKKEEKASPQSRLTAKIGTQVYDANNRPVTRS